MSTTPLSTDFKDDILASANPKRKYQMIYNDDGSVSFTDVTQYDQTGSIFGAKEVNEERAAINNIDERRLVTLDEIDLVTEEGYFVDAKAAAELNRNLKVYTFSKSATVSYSGNNTMSVKCYRQGNVVTTYISYTGTLPKGIIGLSPSGVSGITIPEGFRPNNEAYGSYVGVAGTSVYEADNGRYRISTDGTIYHGCTDESYHERNVTITYHTDDPIPN